MSSARLGSSARWLRLTGLLFVLLSVCGVLLSAEGSRADIDGYEVAKVEHLVPGNISLGANERDDKAYAFGERLHEKTTGATVDVDIWYPPLANCSKRFVGNSVGQLLPGWHVRSHLIRADRVLDSTGSTTTFEGRVDFDKPILAVIMSTGNLTASDDNFSRDDVIYQPASSTRGLENNAASGLVAANRDWVRVNCYNDGVDHPAEGIVQFHFEVASTQDQIRVITDENRIPVAHDSTVSVGEGGSYSGTVVGTDEDGDSVTVEHAAGPTYAAGFSLSPSGAFTYSPAPGFYGTDAFAFRVRDYPAGVQSVTHGTVYITVVPNPAAFHVGKDFNDNNPGSVNIGLACASGSIAVNDATASETDTADFTVTNYTGNPSCTATESVPAGYISNGTCSAALRPAGSCTISNVARTAQIVVSKTFSDGNAADVTISVTCTSGVVTANDQTASVSDPANFTITTFNVGATCTAIEAPPIPGYIINQTACASMTITHGQATPCTISNQHKHGDMVVYNDFSDKVFGDQLPEVTVSLSCSSGEVVNVDPTSTETDGANFTVNRFTGPAAICTATTTAPPGYALNQGQCMNHSITHLNTSFCNMTHTLRTGQIVVAKDFDDNRTISVTVTLTCSPGIVVVNDDVTASESDPANFTVRGFEPEDTCTATETPVSGYIVHQAGCAGLTPVHLATVNCTITNELRTANLSVLKDFSDNNAANIEIVVSCTPGAVIGNFDNFASEADPSEHVIQRFEPGDTCTATESPVPAGYTANQANCAGIAPSHLGSLTCTITNTLFVVPQLEFTVVKDFVPNSLGGVNVTLSCGSGSISPASATASEANSAVFTVTAFTGNPACTATETSIPAGYVSSGTCGASLVAGACTITNTLRTAQVIVGKDFSDNNGSIVIIALTCTSGSVANDDPSASETEPANFTVTGFAGGVPTCTATETPPAGYTPNQSACSAVPIAHLGTTNCTIINTLVTGTFNVNKDFQPDIGAMVAVSLSCATGTVVTNDATATEVPLDSADFTVSGYTGNPICTATESPIPAGYTSTGTCAALLSVGTCTIVNVLRIADIAVFKDFSDNNAADVTVGLACTSGSVANVDLTASEADSAYFTITGFNLGATCTATESEPSGYDADDQSCTSVSIAHGEVESCMITNNLRTADFAVVKDFSDDSLVDVAVSLVCASGSVSTIDGSASEADPADFHLSGYDGNPICTATETPVPGYSSTGSCSATVLVGTCTIINTQTTAPFNVTKDFVPNAGASVNVTLDCATGTEVVDDGDASEADDADFTVNGFSGDPLCTATEAPIPAGYTSSGTCVALLSVGTCTITNTLRTAQVVVQKDFSDEAPTSVTIALTCSSGTVANDDTSSTESEPANFTVEGFDEGATCTATETTLPGYTADEDGCGSVGITHGATTTCTIVNTPDETPTPSPTPGGPTATFTIHVVFTDDNPNPVDITIFCGLFFGSAPASINAPAVFTVSGYSGDPSCAASEEIPAGYTSSGSCFAYLIADGSCTIVNIDPLACAPAPGEDTPCNSYHAMDRPDCPCDVKRTYYPSGGQAQLFPQKVDVNFLANIGVVVAAGDTNVAFAAPPPEPPSNFRVVGDCGNPTPTPAPTPCGTNKLYFDIDSDAIFTGTAEVCVYYDSGYVSEGDEDRPIVLLHFVDGAWEEVARNVTAGGSNRICGDVTSFSPFVVVFEISSSVGGLVELPTQGGDSPGSIAPLLLAALASLFVAIVYVRSRLRSRA